MKKKTTAQIVDKAAEALQLYVRVKAADWLGNVTCVTCGKVRHYKDRMQGGHFIGRKWLKTKLMEENVHPQCNECNGPKRGNMIQYTLFMEDTYGRDFVENLEIIKHESYKYTRSEAEEVLSEIKEKTRELQREKGI